MTSPDRALLPPAAIAAVEGVALIGYAIYVGINGLREGTTGPQEVSNLPALISLIVILAVLGVGMLLITRGWWQGRRWSRSPFILAQIIVVLLGWEASQSSDSGERLVGFVAIAMGVLGIVLAFLPRVARALESDL